MVNSSGQEETNKGNKSGQDFTNVNTFNDVFIEDTDVFDVVHAEATVVKSPEDDIKLVQVELVENTDVNENVPMVTDVKLGTRNEDFIEPCHEEETNLNNILPVHVPIDVTPEVEKKTPDDIIVPVQEEAQKELFEVLEMIY